MIGKEKLNTLTERAFIQMEEENGETAIIGTTLLLVEVKTHEGETAFYTFCNDRRQWIQRALVAEAQDAIMLGAPDTLLGDTDGD